MKFKTNLQQTIQLPEICQAVDPHGEPRVQPRKEN